MLIDVLLLKKNVGQTFEFNYDIDLSEIDSSFTEASIKGKIRNIQGVLVFTARTQGIYRSVCDRCGNDAFVSVGEDIESIFDENGSKDDSVIIDDGKIDITKTVYDSLVLALPMRILCGDDCKSEYPQDED